jgi:UDP-N-acetylmuramate--alanine ligase
MAHTFGLPREIIERAIATFSAIERRMTPLTHIKGIPVYYDYAHHPTEIGAVISALKEKYGAVTVIFRPHTYTRTKSLWRGFVSELGRADLAILLDIYPAREEPIDGVSSQGLAQDIPGAIYTLAHTAAQLAASHAKGVIVLLGAGEVDSVRRDLIDLGEK